MTSGMLNDWMALFIVGCGIVLATALILYYIFEEKKEQNKAKVCGIIAISAVLASIYIILFRVFAEAILRISQHG